MRPSTGPKVLLRMLTDPDERRARRWAARSHSRRVTRQILVANQRRALADGHDAPRSGHAALKLSRDWSIAEAIASRRAAGTMKAIVRLPPELSAHGRQPLTKESSECGGRRKRRLLDRDRQTRPNAFTIESPSEDENLEHRQLVLRVEATGLIPLG